MKFLISLFRSIFYSFLVLLALCFIAFVVVNIFGATILESLLGRVLPCQSVSIGSLRLLPPYLNLGEFYCAREGGPVLRIDSIKAKVNFLKQEVSWVEVKGLDVRFPLIDNEGDGKTGVTPRLRLLLGLVTLPIKEIVLSDSDVYFMKDNKDIGKIHIVKMVLYRPIVENKYFSFNSKVLVESEIERKNGELRSDGWLDWDNKNALFTVEGKDLDMAFLSKLFSLPDVKGIMYLRIEGDGRSNNLVLKNYVKVEQFSAPNVEALKKIPILPAFLPVIDGLSRPEFSLEFTIQTKLDNPKLELKQHLLNAIKKMVKNNEGENNKRDEGQIYDIINDLAGLVGSVLDDLQDIVK